MAAIATMHIMVGVLLVQVAAQQAEIIAVGKDLVFSTVDGSKIMVQVRGRW